MPKKKLKNKREFYKSPRVGDRPQMIKSTKPSESVFTSDVKWMNNSYVLIAGMAICLGLYFRLQIFLNFGVHVDEIWRMMRILSGPQVWHEPTLQAPGGIGYMLLNWILTVFYNTEFVFRLTSLIPSGMSLILVFLICTKIFKSKIIIISTVFLTSFNLFLIENGGMFKPYSIELAWFLTLSYLFLIFWQQEENLKTQILLFFLCFVSALFSLKLIFIFPGIFFWLLLMNYKKRELRSILIVSSVAVFLIAIIFLHYYLFHRGTDYDYLSNDLRYFFIPEGTGIGGIIMFFFQRLFEMIVGAFNNKVFFTVPFDVKGILKVIIPIMFICGLVNLVLSKRFHILSLFGLPIVVMIVFAMMGLWPFGHFRTNLIIIPNFIFLTMFGFELLLMTKKWRVDVITKSFLVGMFMIVQIPFDFGYFKKAQIYYANAENMPAILRYVNESVAKQPPPELEKGAKHLILLNANGAQAFEYFTKIHSKNKHEFEAIRTEFEVLKFKTRERTQMIQQMKQIISDYPNREIWFVLHHFFKEALVFQEIFQKFVKVKEYKLIPVNWASGSGFARTTVKPSK